MADKSSDLTDVKTGRTNFQYSPEFARLFVYEDNFFVQTNARPKFTLRRTNGRFTRQFGNGTGKRSDELWEIYLESQHRARKGRMLRTKDRENEITNRGLKKILKPHLHAFSLLIRVGTWMLTAFLKNHLCCTVVFYQTKVCYIGTCGRWPSCFLEIHD